MPASLNVVMLSIDAKLFEEGSAVRERLQRHAAYAPDWEFHIVVYVKPGHAKTRIAPNMWIYPTNTAFRPLYFYDGWRMAHGIISGKRRSFLVVSQEAMTNLLAVLMKVAYGCRVEVQIHTDFLSPHYWRESLTNALRCIGYSIGVWSADCIRVVTARMKKELTRKLHVPQEHIHVLPIFVDVKALESAVSTFNLKEKYPQFSHRILMVGRLAREKNYPLAFEVLQELRAAYPNAGLVILRDGKEEVKLKNMLQEKGLSGNVVFAGEVVPSDLVSYYKGADVFLHTSNYEGYGMVFIEAAASGIPMVSTDVGLMSDIFVHEESALVAPVGNKMMLAQHLKRVFDTPAYGTRLARGAFQALSAHAYSSKEEYLQRYKESWERCSTHA